MCEQDLILSHLQVTLDTATSFVIGWPITNAVITFRYVASSNPMWSIVLSEMILGT